MKQIEGQKDLIRKLTSKGVVFDKGLSQAEIEKIEKRYNIHFPSELLELYTVALPISCGFYNWRDESKDNVRDIRDSLIRPIKDLLEYPSDIDWSDNWGQEPDNEEEREKVILSKMQYAPQMIPIYGHRYIAEGKEGENPIFSIHDSDIICYGKDLFTYLQTEFGIIEMPQIVVDQLTYIPFWSDFL